MRWSDETSDPNAPDALARRRAVLAAARTAPPVDRLTFLTDLCRGRRVLDVGCVDHEVSASSAERWLHGHVREAAASCVGVDVHAEGVAALAERGWEVLCHDITTGPGPLADLDPFEVVVAGEVIEHVRDPLALLEAAGALLAPGGRLAVTTPNPFAPFRVQAGRADVVWENVDHVTYLFPSGMAELAERAGLELVGVTTTQWDNPRLALSRTVRRRLRSLRGRPAERHDPTAELTLRTLVAAWGAYRAGTAGETALYTLRRPG